MINMNRGIVSFSIVVIAVEKTRAMGSGFGVFEIRELDIYQ